MENVEPVTPRTRQTAATEPLRKSKRLWLQFRASEELLVRLFHVFEGVVAALRALLTEVR